MSDSSTISPPLNSLDFRLLNEHLAVRQSERRERMQKQFHKVLDRLGHAVAAGVDFDNEPCPQGFSLAVTLCRITKAESANMPDTHDVVAAAETRIRNVDD